MNSNKKLEKLFLIIALSIFSLSLNAQHSTSSPYSRFGIGDLASKGNSQTYGMGGVNIAIPTTYSLNSSNPASYSGLFKNTFLLDLGIYYKASDYQTENAQQYNSDANFTHFGFAFAAKKWLYFSGGLKPFSYIGYNVENTYNTSEQNEDIVSYTGQGGLSKVHIGSAIKLFKKLSLGVNLNYLFGTVNRTATSYVATQSGNTSVDILEDNIYKKFVPEFGVQYYDTLFSLPFFVGAVFNQKNELNLNSELLVKRYTSINGNAFSDTISFQQQNDKRFTLPTSWGVGFSVNLYNKFLVAADYFEQNWEETGFSDLGNFSISKESSLAVGLEYVPKLGGNKLRQNIRYRAGFYHYNSYLYSNNEAITTQAVTFGIGLPFRSSGNVFNFSAELGRRGTLDNDLMQENYMMFSFSLSLHDYWFRKFKFD